MSFAKVPGKCQNKMCWLRSGDEKSIPGFPEANPSTSQHPSQAEELVTWQFSSAPRTVPEMHLLGTHPGLSVPSIVIGTVANGRDSLAATSSGAYHLVPGRRLTCRGNSLTQRQVFACAAKGPSPSMLHLTSIHAFGCY